MKLVSIRIIPFSIRVRYALMLLGLYSILFVTSCQLEKVESEENEENKLKVIASLVEQEWAKTHDPGTGVVPRERLLGAMQYADQLKKQRSSIDLPDWDERGPFDVGGRTRALIFDLNDTSAQTVWAGGVAGGLWKCQNIFDSLPGWEPVDDFFDNLAVSCMIQDPQHPDTMYFGTGEGWFNGDAMRGLGIWKSTDGGLSWAVLPSTLNNDFHYVQKLCMDAHGNLLAATRNAGLLRSDNGGLEWEQVLGADIGQGTSNRAADIELGADGSLYASLGIFDEGSVFKSDYSLHWQATGTLGAWENISPAGDFERIELACSPDHPNVLYMLAQGKQVYTVSNIFSSNDGGDSWQDLTVPILGNQAWYDLIAQVSPLDPDVCYIGGTRTYRTQDGGLNWQELTGTHVDHHLIVLSPNDPYTGCWATDGGVYLSTNLDAAFPSFQDKNPGYRTTQFYSAAIHPARNRNEFFGGTQDNGTHRFLFPDMGPTHDITGGDGGFCHIDPDEPNMQLASFIRNQYRLTFNKWVSKISVSLSFLEGWFINPTDYDGETNILYCANEEGEYRRWGPVDVCNSDNCTQVVDVFGLGDGKVTALNVSGEVQNRLYLGTHNGRIVKVEDAHLGLTKSGVWLNENAGMPQAYISCIEMNPLNEAHLIVTFSNFGVPSVWESKDAGNSWDLVEGNLPDMPVRWCTFAPGGAGGVLLATEAGVWYTPQLDGNSTFWWPASDGLANTRVDMLRVREADNNILAATHGRGMFTSNFFEKQALIYIRDSLNVHEDDCNELLVRCGENAKLLEIPVMIAKIPDELTQLRVEVDPASSAESGEDYLFQDTTLFFSENLPDTQFLKVFILDNFYNDGVRTLQFKVNEAESVLPENIEFEPSTIIWLLDNDPHPTSLNDAHTAFVGTPEDEQPFAPFRGDYSDLRCQMLYTAEELQEAGLVSGFMEHLAFLVNEKGSAQPYENASLKLLQTNDSLLSGAFANGGQLVFHGDLSVHEGWVDLEFDEAFYWDGTSNLIIDFCYDNDSATESDLVASSLTGFASVRYKRTILGNGCTLATPSNFTNLRPVIRIKSTQGVSVETEENVIISGWMKTGEEMHFYNNGKVLASLNPLSGDASCVEVSIANAGDGILEPSWMNGGRLSEKIFKVEGSEDTEYEISLYFSHKELEAWGVERFNLNVLKSDTILTDAPNIPFEIVEQPLVEVDTFGYDAHVRYRTQFTGFSYFGLTDASFDLLPAQELRLKVSPVQSGLLVNWESLGEEFIDELKLYRRDSKEDWTLLESISDNKSNFLDRNVREGIGYYYQLRALSSSGETWNSNIVSGSYYGEGLDFVQVFPNPVTTSINLLFLNQPKFLGSLSISLVSTSGQVYKLGTFSIENGTGNLEIPLKNLVNGVYWLNIADEGEFIEREKIILLN